MGTPPGTRSGTPPGGYPDPPGGTWSGTTPSGGGTQTPRGGTRSGTPPGGYPDPPGGGPGQVAPLPPVDRQTPVKTVPSRRTTYAGGNKRVNIMVKLFK